MSRLEVRHREYGSENGSFCAWLTELLGKSGRRSLNKEINTQTVGDKGTYPYGDIGRRAENSIEVEESTPKGEIVKLRKIRLCDSDKNQKEGVPGTEKSTFTAPAREELGPLGTLAEAIAKGPRDSGALVPRDGVRSEQGMDSGRTVWTLSWRKRSPFERL